MRCIVEKVLMKTYMSNGIMVEWLCAVIMPRRQKNVICHTPWAQEKTSPEGWITSGKRGWKDNVWKDCNRAEQNGCSGATFGGKIRPLMHWKRTSMFCIVMNDCEEKGLNHICDTSSRNAAIEGGKKSSLWAGLRGWMEGNRYTKHLLLGERYKQTSSKEITSR